MLPYVPVSSFPIRSRRTGQIVFDLRFYGVSADELYTKPDRSNLVEVAMRRCRIDLSEFMYSVGDAPVAVTIPGQSYQQSETAAEKWKAQVERLVKNEPAIIDHRPVDAPVSAVPQHRRKPSRARSAAQRPEPGPDEPPATDPDLQRPEPGPDEPPATDPDRDAAQQPDPQPELRPGDEPPADPERDAKSDRLIE